MNILVTLPVGHVRDTFIPDDVAEKIESLGNVTWNESNEQFSADELKEKIRYADICITGWSCRRLDRDILEGAERLKLVAHTGASAAPITSDFLYQKGVKVISGNWVFAESVAEGTIAYMLCSLRELPHYSNELQKGHWKKEDYFNEGLLDQEIGLVGFGAIAKYLVRMLEPFRPRLKVYDPYISDETCIEYGVKRTTLQDIFMNSKIISIHAPQTSSTYHMIDKNLIRLIKDGALLVNTARGSIIDEDALADELQKKRFKAILDVYEFEPLPADSKLIGLPNVILIPHMGGVTIDRRKVVTLELIEDIKRFLNGENLKYEISEKYAANMTC